MPAAGVVFKGGEGGERSASIRALAVVKAEEGGRVEIGRRGWVGVEGVYEERGRGA